ncbi:MAG: transposase, partial [Ignavibacteria bacterium]|nr:transposase [Ignavibacteria bacterium]
DLNSRDEYREYLSEIQKDEIAMIRKATSSGRPIGNNSFIKTLEKQIGRILQLQKAGRPKKK